MSQAAPDHRGRLSPHTVLAPQHLPALHLGRSYPSCLTPPVPWF